jgi:predicted nucleic acid-binding protein
LTPAFVYDEIENYEELIVEKSGMEPDRVAQFIDLLFQYIEVVPADDFYPAIEKADEAIGDTDPDDVFYLACAIATDAAIWSDDSDFEEQDLVDTYSTSDIFGSFETL